MFSQEGLTLLLIATALAGCSLSVRYAPRVPGITPGYVEQRLGENLYQVKVGEASPREWQDLEKFAMYRAAEVAMNNGNRYFVVIAPTHCFNSYTIKTTSPVKLDRYGANLIDCCNVVNISGGWYTLDYMLIPDEDAAQYQNVVDASSVIRNLKVFIDSRR